MFLRYALALVALSALGGCKSCSDRPTGGAPSSFERNFPAPVYIREDLHTTAPSIAMGNLEGQITSARTAVKARPHVVSEKKTLAGLLIGHARIVGSPSELREAIQLGEDALSEAPDDLDARLLHIEVRGAAHRFREALAELDGVDTYIKANHISPDKTRMERAYLLIAMGRYDEAKPLVDQTIAVFPSSANLEVRALLLGYMEKPEEAEKEFIEAEKAFADVTPFVVADMYFDRASMWEREGDLPKATSILAAANQRLPQHAHVATHLAALVAPAEAVKILTPVAKVSTDPEVWGALGVYENFVKDGSGDADIARAKSGYDDLMKTMPEAYADHAGWFFLNIAKDPPRAFAAAEKNLVERQNSDAFELYLASATAAGKRSEACAVLERAKNFPYPSPRLTDELRLVGDCTGVPPPPSASASAAPPAPSASPSASASAAPSSRAVGSAARP